MKMKYKKPKDDAKSFVNFNHTTTKKGSGYFLGGLGAFIYYMQEAENFWEVIVGIFKAFTWPAFLVYELLLSIGA